MVFVRVTFAWKLARYAVKLFGRKRSFVHFFSTVQAKTNHGDHQVSRIFLDDWTIEILLLENQSFKRAVGGSVSSTQLSIYWLIDWLIIVEFFGLNISHAKVALPKTQFLSIFIHPSFQTSVTLGLIGWASFYKTNTTLIFVFLLWENKEHNFQRAPRGSSFSKRVCTHVYHIFPVVIRSFQERGRRNQSTGIIDQHIQFSVFCGNLFEHGQDLGLFGHVTLDGVNRMQVFAETIVEILKFNQFQSA